MKAFVLAGAVLLGGLSAVQAADAPATGKTVCLRTIDIRDTKTPDDKTILFYMNNGKVWRNDLRNTCTGLRFYGFAYEVTPPDEICGNLQIIHVLHVHTTCALGPFTEVPQPAPSDHMQK